MATLQELEQAFIAADEAGNTEDARIFAQEIMRMRAENPTPQTPQAEPAAPAEPSATYPRYGQMSPTDLRSYGSGLVEGLRRVVGGGKQLAGAVSDYFTRLDRAGRGHKDKFTAQEMLRAATASAEAEEAGLDPAIRETAAGLSQAGTLAVAPEVALPRATTVVGALAKNVLSGGIGGALTFDPEGSKADDALGGAAVAGTLGLAPSLPPAIKNVVGRGLARVANEGRTASRVASMQRALPDTPVSLAQRTGVPELIYLEHRAYDLDQVNFFADQTDQFIADAARALKQPLAAGQTLGGDAALLKKAMDTRIGQIRNNASSTYDYGVSKAASMAGPDVTVPITNFRNEIRATLDEIKSYARVRDKPPIKESYVEHLESLLNKRAMTLPELSRTLKELTAIQSSDDRIAKAIGTRLRNGRGDMNTPGGLEADLEALQTLPNTDDSIKVLLDTRAEYKRAMQAAQGLADAAVYKMLDGATEPAEMIQRFASYSPSKQANIRDFLAANNPAMLNSLKQGVIDDAIARSGVIREAADAQQDLDRLQNALFEGDQLKTSGLWSPKELDKIDGIRNGLRVIKNTRPSVGSAGTPVAPEDAAINLVSRSAPFMARFITRALTGAHASRFFTDQNIYQLMTQMNRSTTGSATNLAARAALMSYLQENYPAEEEERQ